MSRRRFAIEILLALSAAAAAMWLMRASASGEARALAKEAGLSRSGGEPTSSVATRGVPIALHGWLRDERGEPLADHVLELSRVGGDLPEPEPEATTRSAGDGRFAFPDVQPGSKLISLRGPGEGDLPMLVRDSGSPSGARIAHTPAEGSLYFAVAPQGPGDVILVAPRHASFWVHGQLEFEVGDGKVVRDLPESRRERLDLEVSLVDPRATPAALSGPDARDLAPPGPVLQLLDPQRDTWWGNVFLVGADKPGDTLLVVRLDGFETIERTVTGTSLHEDAGMLRIPRLAHLEIVVVDDSTGRRVEQGELLVRETGGGRPDRETTYTLTTGSRHHDCDRRTGRFEVQVMARGFQDGTGAGDLRIEEEPQQVQVSLAATQDG
jgi:hypothetical protein